MVHTRLVDLDDFSLSDHEVGDMPPYASVSHVWSENLFPVPKANQMSEVQNLSKVKKALETRGYETIKKCWVDTWCINQNSEKDKYHQIPAMQHIYRGAEVVVIVFAHSFSFIQRDWDEAVDSLSEISGFGDWATGKNSELRRSLREPEKKKHMTSALLFIEEFFDQKWWERIWTAQEYLLGRDHIWVSGNGTVLNITSTQIKSIMDLEDAARFGGLDLLGHKRTEFDAKCGNFEILHEIRTGGTPSNFILAAAIRRNCTIPEDSIYGLMGASGITIPIQPGRSLEDLWKIWWATSISKDRLCQIMLPIIDSGASYLHSTWNCVMPSLKLRCYAMSESYLTDFQPFGPSRVSNDGVVTTHGKIAGTVSVDFSFGYDIQKASTTLDRILMCKENLHIYRRFYLASSLGRSTAEILRGTTKFRMRQYKLGKRPGDKENPLSNIHMWFTVYTQGLSYLATLKTPDGDTDILIMTQSPIPKGELLALDLNATYCYGASQKILMIVQPYQKGGETFYHKVGTTHPVQMFDNIESARTWSGCCLKDIPVQQLKLGGTDCEICERMKGHVSKTSEDTSNESAGDWFIDSESMNKEYLKTAEELDKLVNLEDA